MESLLTAVRTSYRQSSKEKDGALVEVPNSSGPVSELPASASDPAEALDILRGEPKYETLIDTLRYLGKRTADFDIRLPSPLAAQIIHVLVSSILPNYWDVLRDSDAVKQPAGTRRKKQRAKQNRDLLLSCLRSVSGLNAILLVLKQQIQRQASKHVGGPASHDILRILLQALTALLEGNSIVESIYLQISSSPTTLSRQKALWSDFLGLVIGGRIIGTAAEAESITNARSPHIGERYWIAEGFKYSTWLARSISAWARALPTESEDGWDKCGELLSKSLRLGYTENIIKEMVTSLLLQPNDYSGILLRLLDGLSNSEQKIVLYCILKFLSNNRFTSTVTSDFSAQWWSRDAETISAAAGLIALVTAGEESRRSCLISWSSSPSGAGVGDGIEIRRAVLAALVGSNEDMETVFEKSLQQCGDPLYIRHTPTLQQEVHTQILLLAAGYVHRNKPLRFTRIIRSGAHLSVVSNRLGASSPRARFLGMIVGEALSGLNDKSDQTMDFEMSEMQTDEAKWYKSLVGVSDAAGSITPLKSSAIENRPKKPSLQIESQNTTAAFHIEGLRVIAVEEVVDDKNDSDEADDGLTAYTKPDSDAEDSDDDPTMVTHNKVTTPVYIRDLVKYLRDTENYDRQKLALSTAAPLIRRKANFGMEVSSHAEELATLLVGLQDKYEIENFQDMRIQGMIAVLVALPLKMGQWFSKTFFDGDYSISQRAAILTTLGVGARELGGFGTEDANLTSMKNLQSYSFPSKLLPKHVEIRLGISATSSTPVDALATQLSNTIITPIVADLADKMTGPSVIKVRTFSSRIKVEKRREKPIVNALAKIVADGFFFPLTGRFFIHLRAYGLSRSNIVFQPYLLALFIKTLSLLIHASGPANLSLPQMTSEFWDLLLSLRTQSIGDITVKEALLIAFLIILEINEDKRTLVEALGRQMLETQEWVEGVFGGLGTVAGGEDEKVRLLAAACLVRIREVVEKYRALLMGDLIGF